MNSFLIKFINLAFIILFVMFFLYIRDLEKHDCVCSDNWKRDYIKYFTAFMVLTNSASLFYPNIKNKLFGRLNFILGILASAYVFIIISWVNHLDKEKCKCSKGWEKSAMKTYAYVVLVFLVLIFITSGMIYLKIRRQKPLTKK